MDAEVFRAVNAIIQYLVIPALAWVWALQKRINDHGTEIKVIAELMKERRIQRDEDRDEVRNTLAKLDSTLMALTTEIKALGALSARVDAVEREQHHQQHKEH